MQQLGLAGFSASSTHRLFFALWPDEATRARLHEAAMGLRARHAPGGRWIGAHRYHLTLQFLGDFNERPAAVVEAAQVAAARVQVAPFMLSFDRVGSFRNRSIPWWLGCAQAPDGLRQLWESLGAELARGGVRVASGKGFVPHLTVLRDAARGLPSEPAGPVDWPVRSFALIDSQFGAHTAYTVLREWPLAAAAG